MSSRRTVRRLEPTGGDKMKKIKVRKNSNYLGTLLG